MFEKRIEQLLNQNHGDDRLLKSLNKIFSDMENFDDFTIFKLWQLDYVQQTLSSIDKSLVVSNFGTNRFLVSRISM